MIHFQLVPIANLEVIIIIVRNALLFVYNVFKIIQLNVHHVQQTIIY